jgi:hypothetical protein
MNLQQLEDDLFIYGSAAFSRIRNSRPKDRFYSFAFFTSGEFAYVLATASSYEGLDEVAAKYRSKASYSTRSLESLKIQLKWSPGDSPLYAIPQGEMNELAPTMAEIVEEFDSFDLDIQEAAFDEFVEGIRSTFVRALKRIDETGLFGRGPERRQVVVNLLLGDQSHEHRLENASMLNPPESVEKLAREQEEESEERNRFQS